MTLVALVAGIAGGVAGAGLVAAWHRSDTPGAVQVTVVHGARVRPLPMEARSRPSCPRPSVRSSPSPPRGRALRCSVGVSPNLDEGTGMIIDDQGDILTNNHVVAGSVAVSVTLHGQLQSVAASVVGTDPARTSHLIRISPIRRPDSCL